MEPQRVFYKGKDHDFLVLVEDEETVNKFKKDSSIALINVLAIYKIFTSATGGSEGVMDEASRGELTNEFGDISEDDIIKKILHEGTFKLGSKIKGYDSSKNDSRGKYLH